MMSPDTINTITFPENFISSQYDKITAIKIETIKSGINSAESENIFSIGMGFALSIVNNQNKNNKELIK